MTAGSAGARPQKALKDLVGAGRLVARVIERGRYVANVVEELTAAPELSAASLELPARNGGGPTTDGKRAAGAPAVSLPIIDAGRPLGTLQVWRLLQSDGDARHLAESLAAPVEVLSQVIDLLPGKPANQGGPDDPGDGTEPVPEHTEAAEQVG